MISTVNLFIRCICGVLKNKCRILVTHQLQYLKAADQILVLKEVGSQMSTLMIAKFTATLLCNNSPWLCELILLD